VSNHAPLLAQMAFQSNPAHRETCANPDDGWCWVYHTIPGYSNVVFSGTSSSGNGTNTMAFDVGVEVVRALGICADHIGPGVQNTVHVDIIDGIHSDGHFTFMTLGRLDPEQNWLDVQLWFRTEAGPDYREFDATHYYFQSWLLSLPGSDTFFHIDWDDSPWTPGGFKLNSMMHTGTPYAVWGVYTLND
jgi:hypothetical protein